MIISPEKIRIIREIIRKRYNAFIVKMGGPELLSDAELKELIAEGLITPEEEGLLKEAYFIGRVRNDPVIKPSERDSITLEEFRRKYKTSGFPITDVEKFALEGIGSNISNYISNLSDKTRGAVESVINQANMDYRNELLGEEGINALTFGMAEHKTINQIAADLRDSTGQFFRDWKRVAITETTNAMNLGEADAIVKRNKGVKPEDIFVYKQTTPDDALCFEENEEVRIYSQSKKKPHICKKVKDLKIGDKLINHRNIHCANGGKFSTVKEVQKKEVECLKVELDDGSVFIASKDHPILIKVNKRGKNFYLFWKLEDVPDWAEIVDVSKLSLRERKLLSFSLKPKEWCKKYNCDDFWDFTCKFKDKIVDDYVINKKTIDQIIFEYGDVRANYISILLKLCNIKIRIGTPNNNFNKKYTDRVTQDIESKFFKIKNDIVSDYMAGYTTLDLSVKYGFTKKRIAFLLKKFASDIYSQHKYKDRGGRAIWNKIKSDPLLLQNIKDRMHETFMKTKRHGSKPQQKVYNVIKCNFQDAEYDVTFGNRMKVDMFVPSLNTVVEYDGSGHNLQVRMGEISEKKLKQNDYRRDTFLKKQGLKVLRIKAHKDQIPSESVLITSLKQLTSSTHNFLELNCA